MMSRFRLVAIAAIACVVAGSGRRAVGQAQLADLTEEERKRPAEEWTLEQALAKGWTPYGCFDQNGGGGERAIQGNRWPQNDPDATRLGACISYSFMPTAVALEPGPPAEGPNTWPGGMPAGSAASVSAAAVTWESVADVHLNQVSDGGGAWDAGGTAGLKADIRIGSGNLTWSNLPPAVPPPGGPPPGHPVGGGGLGAGGGGRGVGGGGGGLRAAGAAGHYRLCRDDGAGLSPAGLINWETGF